MLADSVPQGPPLPSERDPSHGATAPASPLPSYVGDSNRKQQGQDLSDYEPCSAVSYARPVAKKGETGGRKKLDTATLARIAETVEGLFAATKYTVRQASEAWGIDVATLNHARHGTGAVGIGFLIKLRAATGRPIDDLLGLPAIPSKPATYAAALTESIDEAIRFGTPPQVIEYVRRTWAMTHADPSRRKEAWIRAFLRTWTIWAASRVPELTASAKEWLDLHPEQEPAELPEALEAVG